MVYRLALTILFTAFAVFVSAQSVPLPTCDPATPVQNGTPSNSPNGRYTVYIDCYAVDAASYTVYAYDSQTDTAIELGSTAPDLDTSYAFVSRWITDTQVAIRSETGGGTYNWRSVYLADVTRVGSLLEVARDYVARPRFNDNPPRYEWSVEDGITQTFTVFNYDIHAARVDVLYTGDCLLRDALANALSCHMITPLTNASFIEDNTVPPHRLILNIGDSAREIKTVEVRNLPDGELLYTVDALGSGHGEWLDIDTAAIFDLGFDFDTIGFRGVFVRFGSDGSVLAVEPFTVPNNGELTTRPSWFEDTP